MVRGLTVGQSQNREVTVLTVFFQILIFPLTAPLAILHKLLSGLIWTVAKLYDLVGWFGMDLPIRWYVQITHLPQDGQR